MRELHANRTPNSKAESTLAVVSAHAGQLVSAPSLLQPQMPHDLRSAPAQVPEHFDFTFLSFPSLPFK